MVQEPLISYEGQDLKSGEFWLPVKGYESTYWVSSHGRIARITGGRGTHFKKGQKYRIKAAHPNSKGYPFIKLSCRGEKKPFKIHTLVVTAFKGPAPSDEYGPMECHHIDADQSNNHAANLEWRTAKENREEEWHRYATHGQVRRES